MGQLSRGTIISEGLLLAGDDSLTTRAGVWFNAWLRSTYRAWAWPFLNRRISGVALSTGATSLSIGAGAGGVTPEIQRLIAPIYVYDSTKTLRGKARIVNLNDGALDRDESVLDSTINRAMPTQFKVRANSALWGKWDLVPYPFPDQAYLLAFDYLEQPADISANGTVPVYPNDRTMIHAVAADAKSYMSGPGSNEHMAVLNILASMVADDRMKYGEVPGINDTWGLDSGVFR